MSCTKKAPPLVVLTTGDTAPFSMRDSGGNLVGFDIELIKLVAKGMGRTVEFTCVTFEELMNKIKTKEGDVAVAGISITPEREQLFDMIPTGHTCGFVLLVPDTLAVNGLEDLSEKMIGVRTGSWQEHVAKSSWEKNMRNLFVKSFNKLSGEDIVAKLRSGELAAVVLDTDEAKYISAHNSGFKVVPLDAGTFGMGILTCKGSPHTDDIKKVMQEKKEQVDALEVKWFSAKSKN
ncbi:MAG: ABC transporter substrate-binding protein [Holosporales bacterium]|nr:ABC transporter substrate-binding protein [Holosporales bacterium]